MGALNSWWSAAVLFYLSLLWLWRMVRLYNDLTNCVHLFLLKNVFLFLSVWESPPNTASSLNQILRFKIIYMLLFWVFSYPFYSFVRFLDNVVKVKQSTDFLMQLKFWIRFTWRFRWGFLWRACSFLLRKFLNGVQFCPRDLSLCLF